MEQTIPDHHLTLSREKPNMKWSKYSTRVEEVEGANYNTISSGKDFP